MIASLTTGTLETGTLATGTLATGTLATGTLETGTLETGTLETGRGGKAPHLSVSQTTAGTQPPGASFLSPQAGAVIE